MRFGPNSAKVTIRRRALVAGEPRGAFADAFTTWASWRSVPAGIPQVEAGLAQDEIGLVLRVQDSTRNQSITLADRLTFKGQDFAIATVARRDRVGGFVEISLKRHIGG